MEESNSSSSKVFKVTPVSTEADVDGGTSGPNLRKRTGRAKLTNVNGYTLSSPTAELASAESNSSPRKVFTVTPVTTEADGDGNTSVSNQRERTDKARPAYDTGSSVREETVSAGLQAPKDYEKEATGVADPEKVQTVHGKVMIGDETAVAKPMKKSVGVQTVLFIVVNIIFGRKSRFIQIYHLFYGMGTQ
ncbi:hypothetical protein TNCT_598851 [Trichonephila clavata]|uniref:Uncharacterized protein n=1 Tax=Trichonephila clavata TaxID=2740835 RepID=A0A8X6L1M0_TRICU|nr:hypothetical protein TNCT_598851 [Trichonephila clavata]